MKTNRLRSEEDLSEKRRAKFASAAAEKATFQDVSKPRKGNFHPLKSVVPQSLVFISGHVATLLKPNPAGSGSWTRATRAVNSKFLGLCARHAPRSKNGKKQAQAARTCFLIE